MTIQYSVKVRNDKLDAFETTVGTSPVLEIRSGSVPASCATANSGSVLATCSLPSDWMNAASGGSKSMSGTWQDTSADSTGTAGHFRIFSSTGTCHMQGSVTATGGGGDMTVDNTSFASGQSFSVTTFTITAGNS